MILPDARCEIHGELLAAWQTTMGGRPYTRHICRACRRERVRERNGGLKRNSPLDDRCPRGHPKDRFNYGPYGGKKRCIPCARERGRHKR